jgi:V/A-type H+-transporting ATPase subunit D
MLKLKQQQLQAQVRQISRQRAEQESAVRAATESFDQYKPVMAETAGVSAHKLAEPAEVKTSKKNIAGVEIPIYEGISFPDVDYSLFATPVWFDQVLQDLRDISTMEAQLEVLQKQHSLLRQELSRIIQRVNLFEKIKIPEAREAIRIIQIKLGDEMTAAVGRAKIAKNKLEESVTEEEAG